MTEKVRSARVCRFESRSGSALRLTERGGRASRRGHLIDSWVFSFPGDEEDDEEDEDDAEGRTKRAADDEDEVSGSDL